MAKAKKIKVTNKRTRKTWTVNQTQANKLRNSPITKGKLSFEELVVQPPVSNPDETVQPADLDKVNDPEVKDQDADS